MGARPPSRREGGVVDDALNDLYGGRPISFWSAGSGVESMHHTKNFLADGFDGAVRPRPVTVEKRCLTPREVDGSA